VVALTNAFAAGRKLVRTERAAPVRAAAKPIKLPTEAYINSVRKDKEMEVINSWTKARAEESKDQTAERERFDQAEQQADSSIKLKADADAAKQQQKKDNAKRTMEAWDMVSSRNNGVAAADAAAVAAAEDSLT
jgi:hypothetical protein